MLSVCKIQKFLMWFLWISQVPLNSCTFHPTCLVKLLVCSRTRQNIFWITYKNLAASVKKNKKRYTFQWLCWGLTDSLYFQIEFNQKSSNKNILSLKEKTNTSWITGFRQFIHRNVADEANQKEISVQQCKTNKINIKSAPSKRSSLFLPSESFNQCAIHTQSKVKIK